MNRDNHEPLEAQLQQAGATERESKELARLARSLHHLQGQEPKRAASAATPMPPQVRPPYRRRMVSVGLAAIGSILVGVALAAVAQTTYPGTLLYPVKQLTESVAVAIQPNYHGVLMMRRAQEVKQLVALHRSPSLVNATLQNYKAQVARYKGGNYADFEYCENTLRQAEALASGSERLAIAATIASVTSQTTP